MRVLVAAAAAWFLMGCGGGAAGGTAPPPASPTEPGVRGSGASLEDAVQLCFQSQPRQDYAYIANYRCSDGSIPLGGDLQRGAAARVGNVGAGPDGHIVDLYQVPCAAGPVRVYVDMYHCGMGADVEIDPANLTRQQLAAVAGAIRSIHALPFDARAHEMRRDLLVLTLETRQFTVSMCGEIGNAIPSREGGPPYMAEFSLSLAAAVIEDGRPQTDPVAAHVAAFRGLLIYYQAVLATNPAAREPMLDAIATAAADGSLTQRVAQLIGPCDFRGMGVHFAR